MVRQAERHERTLKQIEAKQEKLVQLYYDDGEITGTALTPTYQALAAWNPNLGKATRRHAQEAPNLRSDFVRPTYVGADQELS